MSSSRLGHRPYRCQDCQHRSGTSALACAGLGRFCPAPDTNALHHSGQGCKLGFLSLQPSLILEENLYHRRRTTTAYIGGRAKRAAKASCGETVVQKGVFGESVSSLPPEGFQDISGDLEANLKGPEKKRTLQKHPFGQPLLRTTPSPLLWRTLIHVSAPTCICKTPPLWNEVLFPFPPPATWQSHFVGQS